MARAAGENIINIEDEITFQFFFINSYCVYLIEEVDNLTPS